MSPLQAAWLGSWKTPWELGRGRRWGDPVWALVAIAQAWLLGGHEGRWPLATWAAKRPGGPNLVDLPREWFPRPTLEWISLLRHGSSKIPAQKRGVREDELQAWCWESLLQGDGTPWMAYGSVLLDRETRTRWIPLLGAVDASGCLRLPPFLEPLVPDYLWALPEGWWACLLGSMDPEGRLVPVGSPPGDLPWSLLTQDLTEPLVLDNTYSERILPELAPWALKLDEGWMIDPRLRAWMRGQGASPEALRPLVPASLAYGDPPSCMVADILAGRVPHLPDGWEESIRADLEEGPRPEPPPACGDPVLDRIRVRWGGELPEPGPGYPPWGVIAHPCCDPFHWMAEGQRAYKKQQLDTSLRAFTFAYAHFMRLRINTVWTQRAAANAENAAIFWGDLIGVRHWHKIQGPQPFPYQEHSEALIHAVRGEWEIAVPILMHIVQKQPQFQSAWTVLAGLAISRGETDIVSEAIRHLESNHYSKLLAEYLNNMRGEPPADLDPESRLQWELLRLLRRGSDSCDFWGRWEECLNHPLRLGTALDLLEARPDERTLSRLLELQKLADRMGAPRLQERLSKLWPFPSPEQPPDSMTVIRATLQRLGRPAWLVWGSGELGVGEAPPEGALSRLIQSGSLPPLEAEGRIWRGFPIQWEGAPVAHALVAFGPEEPVGSWEDLYVLAPWLAQLNPSEQLPVPPSDGEMLADGSEPMGSILREIAQVAASELPVLIQGPTGSGKELVACEIHKRSGRLGPLVPVNVSAFAEGVLESELFGHVKGAFTGADRDRKGAIETAEGGTLFLDEVADLSPRLQSMLLRVIQDREVRRVGSDKSRRVDVRFLSATHKCLEQLVAIGTFRQDLLFRLSGTALELPSLRARRHEFPFLLPRLVTQVAREAHLPFPEIAPGVPEALGRLPWPGNFRELRHAIQRALLRCGEGPLRATHFPELDTPEAQNRTWEESTRDFQRRLLLATLRQHDFQVTDAARSLGITRPALYIAAKRLGLDLTAARAANMDASK